MLLTRRWSLLLLAAGVWSWVIWPRFGTAIWADGRAFAGGAPTAFFWVHAVLIVVSLALGTVLGGLGVRGLRAGRRTVPTPGAEQRGVRSGVVR